MTLKIIHKNNASAGQAPAPSDLDIGEIAVNSANAELYIKDNDSAIRTFPNETDINTSITTATTFTQSGDDAVARTFVSKLKDVVSVKDFGAVGDGVTDDTAAIQAAITFATQSGNQLFFPAGTYNFTELQERRGGSLSLIATGEVTLQSTKTAPNLANFEADYAISLGGIFRSEVNLAVDAPAQEALLTLSSVANFREGDLIEVKSSRLIQTDHRGQAREGQLCKVLRVNSSTNQISIDTPLEYFAPSSVVNAGTVAAVNSATEFVLSSGFDLLERDANVLAVVTSGAASGTSRYVTSWDNSTKVAQFGGRQSPWPNTVSLGDTIELRWETKVSRLEPMRLSIIGPFNLTRAPHLSASPGDLGYRGLVITYSDRLHVNGIRVSNFSEAGITLRGCYKPVVENAEISGANRAYNVFDGTGNALSIFQCFEAVAKNVTTTRSRKGIDIGGTQMISWRARLENCSASGGGVGYTGPAFWPVGPMLNTGLGSHGSSYGAQYSNCTVSDVNIGFGIRGLGETISDCGHRGYGDSCARLFYGGGLTIDGFTYNDRFTEIGKGASQRYGIGLPERRAVQFLEVYSDSYIKSLPLVVQNVTCKKLRLAFIHYTRGNLTDSVENVFVGNCVAFASPEGGTNDDFNFIRAENTKTVKGLNDLGGNRVVFDNGDYAAWSIYDLAEDLIPAPGEVYRIADDTHLLILDDDTAIALPLPKTAKTALVSVFDRERDRAYRAVDMILQVDRNTDISPLSASNKVNVDISDNVLTGTTGIDGKMTISFKPGDARFMYVENRLGSQMRPIVVMKLIP